ncbi:MAG: hypothetical protein KDA46_00760 [Parvularculaceae bacterium]|nr:hypothetical protein [Parvularculaceae bacterium]
MIDFPVMHGLHVLAVLMWIGGVGFVTLVLMPSISALPEGERLSAFHRFESRFAPQARIWVLLAGVSGFWMIWRGDMWSRFADPHFWWMHAMVCVWAVFAAMLFIIEPLFLHRRMAASPTPKADFRRMIVMHRVLLGLSLLTVLGAASGSHGLY